MTSPITLGGLVANAAFSDPATIAPLGAITVSDSIPYDQVSATISFTAANGTLSGPGLSAGVVMGGTVTYALSATTAAALQAELRAVVFTPATVAGSTVTTAFDLTVTDVTASPPTTPSATLSSGIVLPQGRGDRRHRRCVRRERRQQHGGGILQRRRAAADAVERDQQSPERGDGRRRRCLRRELQQQNGGGILQRRRAAADAVERDQQP